MVDVLRRLTLLQSGISALQVFSSFLNILAGGLLGQGVRGNLFHFGARFIEPIAVHRGGCATCGERQQDSRENGFVHDSLV
jgi:hypothetical protein